MATASVAADQLFSVPIDKYLKPSPFNPRGEITPESVADLAASMKVHGIQSPIVVRQTSDGPFEIVCGHRRVAAAKLAGLKHTPAILRELTDEQAREIQIVENLQRADIHPMEEAKAYAALRFTFHEGLAPVDDPPWRLKHAERIAAAVGKSIDYVAKRARLLMLTTEAQEIFVAGHFSLDHALLLAALEPADQDQALRYIFDQGGNHKKEPLSKVVKSCIDPKNDYSSIATVKRLRAWIEENVALDLAKVEWDLTDAKLVEKAGACSTCQKSTGANKPLFGGLITGKRISGYGEVEKGSKNVCMDPACFSAKRQAFVQIALGAVAAAGKDTVKLSNKASTAKPAGKPPEDGKPEHRTFKIGQFVPAKKGSCPHVVTGVYVDAVKDGYSQGDAQGEPGGQRSVCVDPACKVHKKAYQKPARSSGYDYAAEEKKREETRKVDEAEHELRVAVAKAAIAKLKETTPAMLHALVLDAWPNYGDLKRLGAGAKSDVGKLKVTSPDFARVAAAVLVVDTLHSYQGGKGNRAEFDKVISLLGGDPKKLRAELTPKAEPEEKKPDAKPATKKKAKAAAAK